jgi:hypothetical protein
VSALNNWKFSRENKINKFGDVAPGGYCTFKIDFSSPPSNKPEIAEFMLFNGSRAGGNG